ncbi:2-isopropylmalate synthase [Arenibaculum sp.]|jgi:2-isopropylmalate synthase|uniref:2-isopropylmalate synthase n=1 Tax=Arenibaculum sp. TaxID=2865862 RepID=UPI002E0E08C8|nr:2-isopropylmalate synthase [Arenibaculum sp.]
MTTINGTPTDDMQGKPMDLLRNAPDLVRIFDTTLRDGEQSPGATLTADEKLEIAHQLARLGVDIIEAGFPASSPGDLSAVQRIAASVGRTARTDKHGEPAEPPTIAAMARANRGDIDQAWRGVRDARHPRIHIVLATSDIHLEYKLRKTRAEVLEMARQAVTHARKMCDDIEFSPEDATRSDPEYLAEVLTTVIDAGATTLNIPDTVGYTTPDEYGALIRFLRQRVARADDVVWSVHCHDDLGLATANTLAGIANGARQVEVSINGIGERAGNACLAETVMALRTRKALFNLDTNITTQEICPTSRMVSASTGMLVQPNKAIVGANAFAHEAGIHQDGMLKNRRTYEIMDAADVGLDESRLVLGKHSGRNALRAKLEKLGYSVGGDELDLVFKKFKDVVDRQKVIDDAQLQALCAELSLSTDVRPKARLDAESVQA